MHMDIWFKGNLKGAYLVALTVDFGGVPGRIWWGCPFGLGEREGYRGISCGLLEGKKADGSEITQKDLEDMAVTGVIIQDTRGKELQRHMDILSVRLYTKKKEVYAKGLPLSVTSSKSTKSGFSKAPVCEIKGFEPVCGHTKTHLMQILEETVCSNDYDIVHKAVDEVLVENKKNGMKFCINVYSI